MFTRPGGQIWLTAEREGETAVVRVRDGASPLALEDARSFLVDRLADYKLPRRLIVREEALPRTAAGKVDKKALLSELREEER